MTKVLPAAGSALPATGAVHLLRGHGLGSCRKRLTSPERWEVNQLIKSGVLDVRDYPTFDDETGQVGWLPAVHAKPSFRKLLT